MIIEIDDDVVDKVVVDTLKEVVLGRNLFAATCKDEVKHFLYVIEYFSYRSEYEEFLKELDECKDL